MKIDDYGTRIAINGYSIAWPSEAHEYSALVHKYSDTAEVYVVVRLHNEKISGTYEKGSVIKRPNFPAIHIRNAVKNYEND